MLSSSLYAFPKQITTSWSVRMISADKIKDSTRKEIKNLAFLPNPRHFVLFCLYIAALKLESSSSGSSKKYHENDSEIGRLNNNATLD